MARWRLRAEAQPFGILVVGSESILLSSPPQACSPSDLSPDKPPSATRARAPLPPHPSWLSLAGSLFPCYVLLLQVCLSHTHTLIFCLFVCLCLFLSFPVPPSQVPSLSLQLPFSQSVPMWGTLGVAVSIVPADPAPPLLSPEVSHTHTHPFCPWPQQLLPPS